jgi:hypothetical protein
MVAGVMGSRRFLLAIALVSRATAQAPPPNPAGLTGLPTGPSAEIKSFTAEPSAIKPGEKVTLRWVAFNTYSVKIDPDIGTVATRGSREVSPEETTTYTLKVTGTGGALEKSVTVSVAGTPVTGRGAGKKSAHTTATAKALPRMPDGKPDFTGIYMGGRDIARVGQIVLKPGAEKYKVVVREDDFGQGAACLPPGVPGATLQPYPLEIVQHRNVVVFLYEAYNIFRIVPIANEHPDDLDPTWMGNSIGRWEGDTLIVDAKGFNDKTNVAGYHHTEDLHVVERYSRNPDSTLNYEASVEDPNVFASPIKYAGKFTPHPEWEIGEYVCAENAKDYKELFNKK